MDPMITFDEVGVDEVAAWFAARWRNIDSETVRGLAEDLLKDFFMVSNTPAES